MEFIDLHAQQRGIKERLLDSIRGVLEHGQYIMGPEVVQLEQHLSDYVGVTHCITCSSGTDALLVPLIAMGIGPGDAVFTTPFTFVATVEVICLLGATPVFADIDFNTLNINPSTFEETVIQTIERGKLVPRAIVPVDLFGLPADYERIRMIAERYELKILEDGAQSFGGSIGPRKACSFGDAGATSFFPAKPLGCYGDGGAIFTDDDELADAMKSIRFHGAGNDKYDNVRIGINGRLDTLQAAILLEKLAVFDDEYELRRQVASLYRGKLDGILETQMVPSGYRSSWAFFSVLAKSTLERTQLRAQLEAAGVPTAIYYRIPIHLQPAYRYLGYREGDFPVAEEVSSRVFSLPMHPYLKRNDINHITEVIRKVVSV